MQNKPRRATGAAARAVGLPRGAATAVLLCALLAPCDAQFTSFTSGASCEANGADSITTLADCSAAAALGLSDTTAEEDRQDGSSFDPPYCYDEQGSLNFISIPYMDRMSEWQGCS